MSVRLLSVLCLLPITGVAAQPIPPVSVRIAYETVADRYGNWLTKAFDSIPAPRYSFRPTPVQQSVGYIAQHLERANYGLCGSIGNMKHQMTAKDSLPDTVKARWPKDTLVRRLLGLVPPSSLPPTPRTAITLTPSALASFVGLYQLAPGLQLDVKAADGALDITSSIGTERRLFPSSANDFFARDVDVQITFVRDTRGEVTGLVLHQLGRDRSARKVR